MGSASPLPLTGHIQGEHNERLYRVPHEITVKLQDVTRCTAVHGYSQSQMLGAIAEN
jgi:hypothetical protein